MLNLYVVVENSELGNDEILITTNLKNELSVNIGDLITLYCIPATNYISVLVLKIVGFSETSWIQEISTKSCNDMGLDLGGDYCFMMPVTVRECYKRKMCSH